MDFFDSNGPWLGKKRDLYEGGIRVPLIARWPGNVSAGAVSSHVSGFQDLMPTLADLAGVARPASDGISIAPTLLGNPDRQKRHPHLYWEFKEQGGKQAVLKGRWKAVRLDWLRAPGKAIQLFDLDADPGEQVDVAKDHPEIVRTMEAIMQQEHTEL